VTPEEPPQLPDINSYSLRRDEMIASGARRGGPPAQRVSSGLLCPCLAADRSI